MDNSANIQNAKQIIKEADAILITAGAGMGVDSGLPDFRGNEGFWRAYPPLKDKGIGFTTMANPEWFESDPTFAWAFYGHRLNLYRQTTPHRGFQLLLDLVKQKNSNYFVFTSNVDGQFQKAGFDAKKIVEVHGSIHHLQCTKNCQQYIWSAATLQIDVDMDSFRSNIVPSCVHCGATARPNILMFGDWKWESHRTDAQESNFASWLKDVELKKEKLAIIEIGAGTVVPTVRMLGEQISGSYLNATLIRVNPRDYMDADIAIMMPGLEGIEQILF